MNSSQKYVDLPPLQFTLRELQLVIQNYRFWIGFTAVVIILTIAGPFGTLQSLNHAERLVYWALHAALTFFTGMFVAVLIISSLKNFGMNLKIAKAFGAVSIGLPVSIIVWFLNKYGFAIDMGGFTQYLKLLGYCTGISISISLIYFLINDEKNAEDINPATEEKAEFLNRLPRHLGTKLLHITSQDHYVKATTELGSELILLRFSDAVSELKKISGMQVHRSFWVADEAVKELQRKNGNLSILTTDGKEFPVSRSKAKSARDRYKT